MTFFVSKVQFLLVGLSRVNVILWFTIEKFVYKWLALNKVRITSIGLICQRPTCVDVQTSMK